MHGSVRHRGWWLAGLSTLSLLALALPAAARADDTWAGALTVSQNWSDAGNWLGGVAPSPAAGTLTFPDLGSCAAPGACYRSNNNLSGIAVSGLVFSNTSGGYQIVGNGLTVGAGGITDAGGGGGGGSATLNTPLTLNGAQTWTIGSTGGYHSVSLAPPATVRGSSSLSVTLPALGSGGDLFVDSDMEVGAVTVTGVGGFHIGGPTTPGSVNGTDGNTVMLSRGATLVANPSATVGPLTFSGASLLLGTGPNNNKTTTLHVNGTASLSSASSTTTFVNANGATPGVDYSQLSASGNVSLGGVLVVDQSTNGGSCVALTHGDVATLVSTTGTLSGTFSNAPNGAIVTMPSSCQATAPQVQIAYTSNRVTATVVTPTATTLATPRPSPAAADQPVTLSATVSTLTNGTIAPNGTVAFLNNGSPIAGCTDQGLSVSGSSGTATCVTSFAATTSPETLTATFTGALGSGQTASSSAVQGLTVIGSTTTSVPPSNPSPGTVQPAPSPTPSTPTPSPPAPRVTSLISASTGAATQVGTGRATLHGSITTGGATVSWLFQYGWGTRYNKATARQSIAAGHTRPVVVSRTVTRLSPNVRYHVRLVVFTRSSSAAAVKTVILKARMFTTRATGRLPVAAGRLTVIGHTVGVSETCRSARRCTGRLSITTTAPAGKNHTSATVVCATQPFAINAHANATVRASITGACLALLKNNTHRRMAAKLTVRLTTGQLGGARKIALALG